MLATLLLETSYCIPCYNAEGFRWQYTWLMSPLWLRACAVILQVFLTQTHLGIVMEYAAGGELFDRIVKAGRFSEDEARFFFQQLISGVEYCHSEVCRTLECTFSTNSKIPLCHISWEWDLGALSRNPLL